MPAGAGISGNVIDAGRNSHADQPDTCGTLPDILSQRGPAIAIPDIGLCSVDGITPLATSIQEQTTAESLVPYSTSNVQNESVVAWQLGPCSGDSSDFLRSRGASSRDGQTQLFSAGTEPLHRRHVATSSAVAVHKTPTTSNQGKNLTCDRPDCNKTFARQWELKRHHESKHSAVKQYVCPVVGCNALRGGGVPAFSRPDKLTSHIKSVHVGTDATAACPAGTCADLPMDLDILGAHIQLYHPNRKQEGETGRLLCAVFNATRAASKAESA